MKIRYRQFSVRTLLVAAAIVAIALSWISYRLRTARRELDVLAEVLPSHWVPPVVPESSGFPIPANGSMHQFASASGQTRYALRVQSDWLSELFRSFNVDMVKVHVVDLQLHFKLTDQDLEKCRQLTSLESLSLAMTRVTDAGIAGLARWPKLKRVKIRGANAFSEAAVQKLIAARPDILVDSCFDTVPSPPQRHR